MNVCLMRKLNCSEHTKRWHFFIWVLHQIVSGRIFWLLMHCNLHPHKLGLKTLYSTVFLLRKCESLVFMFHLKCSEIPYLLGGKSNVICKDGTHQSQFANWFLVVFQDLVIPAEILGELSLIIWHPHISKHNKNIAWPWLSRWRYLIYTSCKCQCFTYDLISVFSLSGNFQQAL